MAINARALVSPIMTPPSEYGLALCELCGITTMWLSNLKSWSLFVGPFDRYSGLVKETACAEEWTHEVQKILGGEISAEVNPIGDKP